MRKEDFFSGEALPDASPFISEQEAIENASFAKYDYDPGARMLSQPVSIYPGSYGYNTSMPMGNFMTPPVGLGSVPNYNYGYQQPYYYGYGYQQPFYQQQPQQIQYHIDPVNFGGSEYLPPLDYEDKIEKLKLEYWLKEQEQQAQTEVDRSGYRTNNGYGFNYYGMSFYNPYQYNSINSDIRNEIQKMEDEAKENRFALNFQLSKVAHNYLGDIYNESDLEERFRGKILEGSFGGYSTYQDIYNYNRFQNLEPFDNSQMYRDHFMNVSREHNEIIPKDSNLSDTFKNMGVLHAHYELEEESHRRRNGAVLYDSGSNSYKYFVKARAAERYAKKNNIDPVPVSTPSYGVSTSNPFPTLSQSARLTEDGTLNITCNFGNNAGKTYSVHNSQEAGYEEDRARFQSFIDSIPGSIYLNGGNVDGK